MTHHNCTMTTDNQRYNRVYIDSRCMIEPTNSLFVALRTANNDGHLFVKQAYDKGIRNFMTDHTPDDADRMPDATFTIVSDTLKGLQQLAINARQRLDATVIAITGSRGKTILKEILFQALTAANRRAGRSPRSYNSQIGVPLSILSLKQDTEIAVIEAGISQPGEMERLEGMIKPAIGVLTNITNEHSDGFANRQEQIAQKIKLFKESPVIIYNATDPDVDRAISDTYPHRKLVRVNGTADEMPRRLAHAVLTEIGYSSEQADTMLANTETVRTRLNVIEGMNGCKLIYDRFTCDIDSLADSLEFMNRRSPEASPRTLILATDHLTGPTDRLSRLAEQYNIGRVILVGHRDIPGIRAERFSDAEALCNTLSANDFIGETILLKGPAGSELNAIYYMLEAKQHETVLEINLDAMVSNFNFFRSKIKPSTGIICMLKAAGYGAGSVELAGALQAQGASYLAVAVVDEGVELRDAGITMPIMVLNPRAQNHKMMFDYRLEPEIYSFEMLEEVIANARRYGVRRFPIHIKLETGMRRLGFLPSEISQLAEILASTTEVKVATVFSHLACADDSEEDDYTRRQFEIFNQDCDILQARLPYRVKRHILNSTGIIRFPEQQHDFVRLGIGLYGIPTLNDGSMSALKPVSSLSSVIISIKHWKKGDTIGYNRRGVLNRDSVIATVPIGYADGLNRHLGRGKASLVVNGQRCPTVGNICMDICMIDVTDVACQVGDRVEIFGDNVSAIELAQAIDTIPYEILTSISPRVKRVYYRE